MAATKANPIVLYDIIAKDGTYWAPSPFKTRLTLNHKQLPYRIKYIKLEEIEPLMKSLGLPPTSKVVPYYTLPMIADPSPDPTAPPTYVRESFHIALYLDTKYPAPAYPIVFPDSTHTLQKVFVESYFQNLYLAVYLLSVPYALTSLLDEASQEYVYRSRGGNGVISLSSDEALAQKLAEMKEGWDALGHVLDVGGGPWVLGKQASFSDFAIASGLLFMRRANGTDGKLWTEVSGWGGGRWGEFWKRIEEIEEESTEVA